MLSRNIQTHCSVFILLLVSSAGCSNLPFLLFFHCNPPLLADSTSILVRSAAVSVCEKD